MYGHDLPEMLRITLQAGKAWPSISQVFNHMIIMEGRVLSRPFFMEF